MRLKSLALAALALPALPLSALAETYTVTSLPTAVTVYGGFAMVTRQVSVDIIAGAHEVVLPDLPQWVDAGSLRVAVRGAELGSTRLRRDALPPRPDTDSAAVTAAKERIEGAKHALRDLEDAVQDAGLAAKAAQAQLAFLAGLGGSDTLPSDPAALADLAQMIAAQTLAATQSELAATRAARALQEDREPLERELADARAALAALTPPAAPMTLLAVGVVAAQAGTIIASVSYPVRASWQPTYDVVLARDDADTLTLRRAALITQNSGENWEDVMLTLSTLAPSGQVVPSELYPQLLRFEDKIEYKQQDLQRGSRGAGADLMMESDAAPAAMMAPRPTANFDGPGVTYALPDTITIAQGAEDARVELDTLGFDARVYARAVPVRDTTAFLMAEAMNESREPLLAANTAQLFVDGALVGQTGFAAVPAGGDITQAFGPIEALRLRHAVLDRSEGDRGLINRSNAQTTETRLTIENIGSKAWDVEVMEAAPYSEQDDLVIDWSAKPAPDARDVDDRRGLIQWDITVQADSTVEIMTEQTVRWPDGKVLR